ncbi:SET domain-containing protein, partial [Pisolithus marmoratus]
LSLRPHVFTLSTKYLDSHCSRCAGSPASGLKRCTGCRKVWYCTSACQNNDWPIHKFECTAIQNWSNEAPSEKVSVPSDAVRCLARILWQIKRKSPSNIWAKEIQAMQSNRQSIHPTAVEGHTHLAQSLVRYLGASSPTELESYGIMSTADLVDFIINTVALTTPSLTPIGVAVSPLVALINHSCAPNVVVVFPRSRKDSGNEPVVKVAALRNIAPGEEILMSYVDTTLPKSLRQMALMETYNFQCRCWACTESSEVDPREAVWCPTACGGTSSLPTETENRVSRCNSCGAAINDPDAVMDATRVGQEALDKAGSLQGMLNSNEAKLLTTNIISVLMSARLTPSTHPLLALLKLHQTLLISSFQTLLTQEVLNETIRTAGKYSAGLSAVLDEGHPVRAMALVELGKLLAVDEPSPAASQSKNGTFPPSGPARLRAAYETLLRARADLLIGFGRQTEGGEVGADVRETLVALEKELGVWSTGIRNVLEDTLPPARIARVE